MEQSTAQANALKTLDARRAAAAAPPPLPPLNDPVMRPQQPGAPPPQYQQPGYQQRPYQQPGQAIIVQQPNNGLMHGVIGFMLGQSLSSGHRDVVYQSNGNNGNGNNGNGSSGSNGSNGGSAANGSGADGMAAVPAAPTPSFGANVLRLFAWMVLLGGLAWLLYFVAQRVRRARSAGSTRNYSFERN